MSLDRCGQLYGQLIQICDVHKGITIDSLDVLFVLPDSGRNEQYSLAPVLLLDAAEIFLGGTAVVTGCCRLTIGYKDQDLYLLRPFNQLLGHKTKRGAVAVAATGSNVHHAVFIIVIDAFKLRIGIQLHTVAAGGMTVNGDRDMQRLAEVI